MHVCGCNGLEVFLAGRQRQISVALLFHCFFRVCVFFLLSLEKSRKNSLDIWFFQHQEWTYAGLKLLAERNELIEFCRPFLLCMRNACLVAAL